MLTRCGFFSLRRALDQPSARTDALTVTMGPRVPSLAVIMRNMVEGMTVGPGSVGGRTTVVPET
jgi:hypothetical protein